MTEELVGVEVSEARLRGPGHGRDTSTGSFFQEGGLGATGEEELSPAAAGACIAAPAFNTHTSASSGRGGMEEWWEGELAPSTSDPGDTPPKRKKVVVQG